MGGVGLGHHKEAGGILVKAVDNARPLHPADAGEAVAAMSEEGVDQRTPVVAGGGMDDKTGGLVDDDDVPVLEDNVEGDVLGGGFGGHGRRHVHPHRLTGLQFGAGILRHGACHGDGPAGDQLLEAGAAHIRELPDKELVQPLGLACNRFQNLRHLFRCPLCPRFTWRSSGPRPSPCSWPRRSACCPRGW